MADKILHSFLAKQLGEGIALAESSDVLDLAPLDGPPPRHYIATFHARGLVKNGAGKIAEATRCDVGIWLPKEYLRHVIPGQVLTYLGPHRQIWHPNVRPPYICVRIKPATPLVDLLYTIYELWTWRLYYTGDNGLNLAAAQWARRQDPARFPIDPRPLKRRALAIDVTPAGGEEAS